MRRRVWVLSFSGLVALGQLHATDVTMLSGNLHFSVPDDWQLIMQTDGESESRVFRVPDPSPTGQVSLARITVTASKVGSLDGFQAYVAQAASKASALTGYQRGEYKRSSVGENGATYSAQENGVQFAYRESYWFSRGYALQLRCVRPAQSQAGTAWQATFDRGCAAIASRLSASS